MAHLDAGGTATAKEIIQVDNGCAAIFIGCDLEGARTHCGTALVSLLLVDNGPCIAVDAACRPRCFTLLALFSAGDFKNRFPCEFQNFANALNCHHANGLCQLSGILAIFEY